MTRPNPSFMTCDHTGNVSPLRPTVSIAYSSKLNHHPLDHVTGTIRPLLSTLRGFCGSLISLQAINRSAVSRCMGVGSRTASEESYCISIVVWSTGGIKLAAFTSKLSHTLPTVRCPVEWPEDDIGCKYVFDAFDHTFLGPFLESTASMCHLMQKNFVQQGVGI